MITADDTLVHWRNVYVRSGFAHVGACFGSRDECALAGGGPQYRLRVMPRQATQMTKEGHRTFGQYLPLTSIADRRPEPFVEVAQ